MSAQKLFTAALVGALVFPVAVLAAPAHYTMDPDHTHPEFEVDHMGGLSVWRGIFKKSAGTVILDKEAKTGSVDVTVDTSSADMAHDKLTAGVISPEVLDSAKYPTAHYTGTLGDFVDGKPTTVTGQLTLHGVTKPVNLKILSFKCQQHVVFKREVCGADATGTFNRADFGVNVGDKWGFDMTTTLRIQVEALIDK